MIPVYILSDCKVCQFNFIVSMWASCVVRFNPGVYQRFVWVSEDDIKTREPGGIDLDSMAREANHTGLSVFNYYRGSKY